MRRLAFALAVVGAVACADDDSKADRTDSTGQMVSTMPATTAAASSTTAAGTAGSSTGATTTVGSTTVGVASTSGTSPTSTGTSESTGCRPDCSGIACGVDPSCGVECGTCGPSATCADDQSYCGLPIGFSVDFGSTATVVADVQLGHRITVFQPRIVRRLAVIAAAAGPDARLALYAHDGAGPSTLLVETAVAPLVAGPNELDVAETMIDPGDYWILIHTSGDTDLAATAPGDNNYERAELDPAPFMDGFAADLATETITTDRRHNLYLLTEE